MRIEKGYGSWSREYSPEWYPTESRMDFLVKTDKPEFHGRRFGSITLGWLAGHCGGSGAKEIRLRVNRENAAAIRAYEKNPRPVHQSFGEAVTNPASSRTVHVRSVSRSDRDMGIGSDVQEPIASWPRQTKGETSQAAPTLGQDGCHFGPRAHPTLQVQGRAPA